MSDQKGSVIFKIVTQDLETAQTEVHIKAVHQGCW